MALSIGNKRVSGGEALVALAIMIPLLVIVNLAVWSVGVWFWLNFVAGFGLGFWQVVGIAGLAVGVAQNVGVQANSA